MNKRLKILFVLVGIVMAFLVGVYFSGVTDIKKWGQPRIYSESAVRDRYPSLPANAAQVFYANKGFTDVDFFLAFTASEKEIDAFLADRFSTALLSFKPIPAIPEMLDRLGPQHWEPKHQYVAWNLAGAGSLVAWTNDPARTLIYSKRLSRLFVCEWGR